MKINSLDIKGKKIISEKEGLEIGIAKDLFFDTKDKKVVALLTDTSNGIENSKGVLLKNTKSIAETIIINSKNDLKPSKEIIKPEKDNKGKSQVLTGSKQITEDGEDLGEIKAVIFDQKSGKILEIVSIDKGEEKIAKIDKIVTVSPGMAVVKGKDKNAKQENPVDKIKTIFQ